MKPEVARAVKEIAAREYGIEAENMVKIDNFFFYFEWREGKQYLTVKNGDNVVLSEKLRKDALHERSFQKKTMELGVNILPHLDRLAAASKPPADGAVYEKPWFVDRLFKVKKAAEYVMADRKFKTIDGEVLIFNPESGLWEDKGEEWLKNEATIALDEDTSSRYVSEVVFYVKSTTTQNVKDIEPPARYIPFQNGIYDLEGDRLIPYSPDFFFRTKLAAKYDPEAKCPGTEKFFRDIFSEDDIALAVELIGWTLYREYEPQKVALLFGHGSNGKSKFLKLVGSILGAENITTRSLQSIANDQFAAAGMKGKYGALGAEMPATVVRDTGLLKMLTGGDQINVRKMRSERDVKFVNFAKLIFSGNKLPPTNDESFGFWRRVLLVEMPFKFEEGTEPKCITDPTENSGIVNYALRALKKLRATHRFSYNMTIDEVKQLYAANSSTEWAFATVCLIKDTTAETEKESIFDGYVDWCVAHARKPHPRNTFWRALKDVMPDIEEAESRIELEDGRRKTVIRGFRLDYVKDVKDKSELIPANKLTTYNVVFPYSANSKLSLTSLTENEKRDIDGRDGVGGLGGSGEASA